MKVLTNTFLSDLKYNIDSETITNFCIRYSDEMHQNSEQGLDNTTDIQTPSTVETTFKRGCAISKARRCQRPNTKSKEKIK